jgi:glutathione S-transferase
LPVAESLALFSTRAHGRLAGEEKPMSKLRLYYHPFTRAAGTVSVLEEVGQPYELEFVDITTGEHKQEAFRKLNAMGKLPILRDGEAVISETSAIAMYLADRYAMGRLAPAIDAPLRGPYLRWCVFPSVVIEPASMAKLKGWDVQASQAGWGSYETVLDTMRAALENGPWLLGEMFTMADVLFAGTLGYMLRFGMLEPRPEFTAYVERFRARPAIQAAEAKNAAIVKERGLDHRG